MQDFVGKQIDRYRITERLGMGGMAVVYKAYDTRLERDVALKIIRTEAIPPEQYERLMKRFEREAKSQARFDHKNIVTVFDYGNISNAPYLVMSYIPGGTLKLKMAGPVDWQQAVRWLIPIAEALVYAHEYGVVHRDVKPSNILFDKKGQPILTDFGIAKLLETDEATLTGTGMGVGTPEYMAPEQWQGQVSEATDQYALGVVLYELVTGQKPYTADTPAAIILMQATEPLRAPSQIVKGTPEEVEKVLYKALARDPGDRYEDMNAFRGALERLFDRGEVKSPEPVKKAEITNKPESIPVVDSEGETRDALDPTPVEIPARRKSDKSADRKKGSLKKLPAWVPWGLLGILAVVLLLVLILSGGSGEGPEPIEVGGSQLQGPDEILIPFTATIESSPTRTSTEPPTETATITQSPTITMTPTKALGVGSMLINEKDGAEMVYVPAGVFNMGINEEEIDWIRSQEWCTWYNSYWGKFDTCWERGFQDETPIHEVNLDSYWIYKYEVTNAQYAAFLNEMGNKKEGGYCWSCEVKDIDVVSWYGQLGTINSIEEVDGVWQVEPGYEAYPVSEITWNGADAYCEWVGGRLPTEAEWEKAARGEDQRLFPWGDTPANSELANYHNYDDHLPSAVGSYPNGASPYGVLDMAGNVAEWVNDGYSASYYYDSPFENPQGLDDHYMKVIRGGSWKDRMYSILSTSRTGIPAYTSTNSDFGFRCVVDD